MPFQAFLVVVRQRQSTAPTTRPQGPSAALRRTTPAVGPAQRRNGCANKSSATSISAEGCGHDGRALSTRAASDLMRPVISCAARPRSSLRCEAKERGFRRAFRREARVAGPPCSQLDPSTDTSSSSSAQLACLATLSPLFRSWRQKPIRLVMSIRDRISAFERGGQPTAAAEASKPTSDVTSSRLDGHSHAGTPANLAPARTRDRASSAASASGSMGSIVDSSGPKRSPAASTSISPTLAASSVNDSALAQSEEDLSNVQLAQRPGTFSSRRDRAEIPSRLPPGSSSASAPRPVSPPAVAAFASTLDARAFVGSTSARSGAASKAPPLPQRQVTLSQASSSAVPATRLPPLAAKPAHLAKGRPSPTPDLTFRTTALPSGGDDMINFSPIGLASSSASAVNGNDSPRPTSRPAPPALPSRQSTVSSVSSLPPPLPSRKPTLPAAASPAAQRQPPPPPKPSQPGQVRPGIAGSSPSPSSAQAEAASARYSALFTQLLALRRVAKMKRMMAGNDEGWTGTEERDGWLQGVVVRAVWNRSKLSPDTLREIWCALLCLCAFDLTLTGPLSPPAGMTSTRTARVRSTGRALSAAWLELTIGCEAGVADDAPSHLTTWRTRQEHDTESVSLPYLSSQPTGDFDPTSRVSGDSRESAGSQLKKGERGARSGSRRSTLPRGHG